MNVSSNWQKAYRELTEFIADYSEVAIGARVVSIPEGIRPEFYRLFNTLRMSFVEEKFPYLLSEAATLSQSYN